MTGLTVYCITVSHVEIVPPVVCTKLDLDFDQCWAAAKKTAEKYVSDKNMPDQDYDAIYKSLRKTGKFYPEYGDDLHYQLKRKPIDFASELAQ